MKRHFYLTLLFFYYIPNIVTLYAQEQFATRYNTTYVTMDNGLLHNFIDDVYKDSRGFLWISTGGGGLSRYDGYEFVHYNTNTAHMRLKSNFIKNVCEDNFGRLWIVSEGGIDILDLSKQQPIIPADPDKSISEVLEQSTICVLKDSKGAIWLYGGSALHKITFNDTGNIARIFTLSTAPLAIQTGALNDTDEDGNIWAGLGNEVCKLHEAENGKLKALPVAPCLTFETGTFISSFKRKKNEVWIGTDRGLYRYDRNKEIAKRYEYQKDNRRSLTQSHVTGLAVTADKQLLVSTLKGINIYNPISDDFECIIHENKVPAAGLNSNFVNCLLTDGDIIWCGSETGGINKMTPRKLSVRNYISGKENAKGLSGNLINSIYEDAKGNLWVGTVEGGLNRKAKGSDRFTCYTAESSAKLSHNSISALTGDHDNRLWVGTWGNGISVLDSERPERPAVKYISSQTHPEFNIEKSCEIPGLRTKRHRHRPIPVQAHCTIAQWNH